MPRRPTVIERFVMLKFNDDAATPAGRKEVLERARDMLPRVPGVTGVRGGVPGDAAAEQSWDVALVVQFNAIEDVGPYIVHPVHQQFVQEVLSPRVACRKVWNFEVE